MKRVGVFAHTDLPFVQYLKQLLEQQGIECIIRNDNVALAGIMERAAQTLSPELWVMDDGVAAEAARLVREVDASAAAADPGVEGN